MKVFLLLVAALFFVFVLLPFFFQVVLPLLGMILLIFVFGMVIGIVMRN